MITTTSLTVVFYSQVLQNGYLQVDFLFVQSLYLLNSFWINIFFTVFTIISLLIFTSFTVLLYRISSANVLVFRRKNLILHNFSFNWKVAAAAAVTSFNHVSLWVASASNELRCEVTDVLNLRCNFNGSHQSEYLFKLVSTTDFSRYPKASCLSRKGLHHRRIYSKA